MSDDIILTQINGKVDKRYQVKSGKGDNIEVLGVRYFISKDNPDFCNGQVGEEILGDYEKSGKDGSLKLIHHLKPGFQRPINPRVNLMVECLRDAQLSWIMVFGKEKGDITSLAVEFYHEQVKGV